MTRIAVLLSRIRVEEKLLLTALEAAGAEDVQVIDDGQVVMPLAGPGGLERGNGHLDPATPAGQLRRVPTWCSSVRSAHPAGSTSCARWKWPAFRRSTATPPPPPAPTSC